MNNIDETIRQVKNETHSLKKLYEKGTITKDQYIDLIDDKLDVEKVNQISDNIKERAQIASAFAELKNLLLSTI